MVKLTHITHHEGRQDGGQQQGDRKGSPLPNYGGEGTILWERQALVVTQGHLGEIVVYVTFGQADFGRVGERQHCY